MLAVHKSERSDEVRLASFFQSIFFMILIQGCRLYLTLIDFPPSVKNCLRLWNKKGTLELMRKEMLHYCTFLRLEILDYSMYVAILKDKHFSPVI